MILRRIKCKRFWQFVYFVHLCLLWRNFQKPVKCTHPQPNLPNPETGLLCIAKFSMIIPETDYISHQPSGRPETYDGRILKGESAARSGMQCIRPVHNMRRHGSFNTPPFAVWWCWHQCFLKLPSALFQWRRRHQPFLQACTVQICWVPYKLVCHSCFWIDPVPATIPFCCWGKGRVRVCSLFPSGTWAAMPWRQYAAGYPFGPDLYSLHESTIPSTYEISFFWKNAFEEIVPSLSGSLFNLGEQALAFSESIRRSQHNSVTFLFTKICDGLVHYQFSDVSTGHEE